MPEEPLFEHFWAQNLHVSYFLYHGFVVRNSFTVRTRGPLLLRTYYLLKWLE